MRVCPLFALVLGAVALPLAAAAATNLELRCERQVVRVAPGAGEPADAGSYDVRVYDATNGAELVFLDGMVLPRDGAVAGAWFSDLNSDGRPEIVVWVVAPGGGAEGHLDLLFFDEDGLLQRAEMPQLAKSWQRGYQGHDTYRVERGVVYRTFPVYRTKDPANQPSGGERTLKLIFEKERWMWRLHAIK
jgi:hypothetical protein